MYSRQQDIELIRLAEQFNNIAKEIQIQKRAIYYRFNVQAKYVVLGIDSLLIIQQYAHAKAIAMGADNYQQLLGKYFNLIGIVDTHLFSQIPKDFVQVMCPTETYL
jgi:hypothetical protein